MEWRYVSPTRLELIESNEAFQPYDETVCEFEGIKRSTPCISRITIRNRHEGPSTSIDSRDFASFPTAKRMASFVNRVPVSLSSHWTALCYRTIDPSRRGTAASQVCDSLLLLSYSKAQNARTEILDRRLSLCYSSLVASSINITGISSLIG